MTEEFEIEVWSPTCIFCQETGPTVLFYPNLGYPFLSVGQFYINLHPDCKVKAEQQVENWVRLELGEQVEDVTYD